MSDKETVWHKPRQLRFEPFEDIVSKDKSHIEYRYQTSIQVTADQAESLLNKFDQDQNEDRKTFLRYYLPDGTIDNAKIVAVSLAEFDLNQVRNNIHANSIRVIVPLTDEQITRIYPDVILSPTFGY